MELHSPGPKVTSCKSPEPELRRAKARTQHRTFQDSKCGLTGVGPEISEILNSLSWLGNTGATWVLHSRVPWVQRGCEG
eukprot:1438848-Alexandrium_andersonii.AAC.1